MRFYHLNIMKKFFDTVFSVAHAAFVLLIIIFGLFVLSTAIPLPGNFQIKIVQSGSMEPAIKTGAVVVIKPVGTYDVGDVITFGEDSADSVPTTHRIVNSRLQAGQVLYTTKGDANDDADIGEISQRDIIGKVLFDIPYLGFVLDFARKPIGFVLFVGIPVGIIFFEEVRKIIREVKKARQAEITDNSVDTEQSTDHEENN
jgi:signal peptidase